MGRPDWFSLSNMDAPRYVPTGRENRQKTHRSRNKFALRCGYRRTAVEIYLHRSAIFAIFFRTFGAGISRQMSRTCRGLACLSPLTKKGIDELCPYMQSKGWTQNLHKIILQNLNFAKDFEIILCPKVVVSLFLLLSSSKK